MSVRRAFTALALAGGLTVLGLAALEAALRLREDRPPPDPPEAVAQWDGWRGKAHRASQVPGLVYELVPGLDRSVYGWRVRTNELGMRDDPPETERAVLRIAAIGDSFTFGWGVDQEETWPVLLERGLDRSILVAGRAVDVLNLGVSGYSTRDELVVLEQRTLPLDPAIMVLQYCVNDPETRPIQPLHRYFTGEPWWRGSLLVRKIARRLEQRRYGPSGGYFEWLHDPQGEPWQGFVADLERMKSLCAARAVPAALVIFPLVGGQPWEQYRYRALHAQVAAEGQRQGFAVLDLLEVFEREPPEALSLGADDVHPNARGQALAAEAVKRFLHESGVLAAALDAH